jgi:dihydrofolate reductase
MDLYDNIGVDNTIPWYYKEELKLFKQITSTTLNPNKKNVLIMGRNTWESLPKRPLNHRMNIILTSNLNYKQDSGIIDENVQVFASLDQALFFCNRFENKFESIFVIGGQQLYHTCIHHYLQYIDMLYISIIQQEYPQCNKHVDMSSFLFFLNMQNVEYRVFTEENYDDFIHYAIKLPEEIDDAVLLKGKGLLSYDEVVK